MVIIYINFVDIEYIMLHAKFQDHRAISSSSRRIFLKVFSFYHIWAYWPSWYLGHVAWTYDIDFLSPLLKKTLHEVFVCTRPWAKVK